LVVLLLKDKPEFIYYGWKPYSDANLVNNEGLPASTFKIKVE
jgi:sialate O-acetylesterase